MILERQAQEAASTNPWTPEEFAQLVEAHRPSLVIIARGLTKFRSQILADDLVGITLEKALRAYPSFKSTAADDEGRKNNLAAWLNRILRNTWIDEWRKLNRHNVVELHDNSTELVDGQGSPERAVIIKDLLAQTLAVLAEKARPEQYEALLLFARDGLSYEEIAAWQTASSGTEVTIGTVKSRIFRAREHLSELPSLDD